MNKYLLNDLNTGQLEFDFDHAPQWVSQIDNYHRTNRKHTDPSARKLRCNTRLTTYLIFIHTQGEDNYE